MMINRTLSIAPMMEYTDRHFRFLMRIMTQQTLLYTEMVHAGAIVHGDAQRHLAYSPEEHPLALQLGGSCPELLSQACQIAQSHGVDEINLNVGCPSPRVQSGAFGACLMKEPDLVADLIAAMQQSVSTPITLKTRIGVDDRDSYEQLCCLLEMVAKTGCRTFLLHARKAWLSGLSPKENRTIPPLDYERVYRIKQDYPEWEVIINGGVMSLDEVQAHLTHVDGVMMGRAACQHPYLFVEADHRFFGGSACRLTRQEVVDAYLPYLALQCELGVPWRRVIKPLLGLYHGQPFARRWRQQLCELSGDNVALAVQRILKDQAEAAPEA